MIVSVRFEAENGASSGRCALYVRKSLTCLLPLGHINYDNEEERKELEKIVVAGHSDVNVIGPEVDIGDFHEVYVNNKR